MKICIIDLDVCNVHSVSKCVEHVGFDYTIAKDPSSLLDADKIIFPGIGSYSSVVDRLHENKWIKILQKKIIDEKKDYLGICLGMQILTETGYEFVKKQGLNFIKGEVVNLKDIGCNDILPHTGWNSLDIKNKSEIFEGLKDNVNFYFNHSFVMNNINKNFITSTSNYKVNFISSVKKDNIYGVQFHPEKSSESGIKIIKNFLDL
jgi:glutamine amidotransferase